MTNNLRKLRCERSVSAETMAQLLGLKTKAAYYKKETGSIKFSLDEAKSISDYFGLSLEKIFFENDSSC